MARLMSDGFWTTDGVGYLNQQHKTANAQKIYMFFSALGWSRAAICGLLGNIEIECRFDPQNIYGSLTDGAYGFTQWHPPTKLINWCNTNNIDYRLGSSQLRRIQYEWRNNLQWQYTGMTFAEYAVAENDPEYLARTWAYHYEVADRGTWDSRAEWARYYYDHVRGKLPIWLYFKMIERRGNNALYL